MVSSSVITLLFFTSVSSLVAADPDQIQDICVADLNSKLTVNGYPCKDPSLATVDDFVFSLAKRGDTLNPIKSKFILGSAKQWPGLNTLGLSIARLDMDEGGIILPHIHPLASELVYVEEGTIYTGFVTMNNRLFAKVLNKGEVIVIPRALVHWQLNVGKSPAKAIVTLNNQRLGVQEVSKALFTSGIRSEVLEKTFFISKQTVQELINGTLRSSGR